MSVRHCSGKLTMLFTKTDNAAMQRPLDLVAGGLNNLTLLSTWPIKQGDIP